MEKAFKVIIGDLQNIPYDHFINKCLNAYNVLFSYISIVAFLGRTILSDFESHRVQFRLKNVALAF